MISQDELKTELEYSEETGIFKWKVGGKGRNKDMSAGYIIYGDDKHSNSGYVKIGIRYKKYYAHRLAWIYVNGAIPDGCEIDHINHNRSDNRISNLRLVSRFENCQNVSKHKSNTSGVSGVTYDKNRKKWVASVNHNGKRILWKRFDFKEEAEYEVSKVRLGIFHNNHGE